MTLTATTTRDQSTNKPTHTPGPWGARPQRGTSDSWWVTATPQRPAHSGYIAQCVARDSANEANARLIAAAPDMLAELREIADLSDEYVNEPTLLVSFRDAARILVAKAEGR